MSSSSFSHGVFCLVEWNLFDCRIYRSLALFTRRISLGLHPTASHMKLGSLEWIGWDETECSSYLLHLQLIFFQYLYTASFSFSFDFSFEFSDAIISMKHGRLYIWSKIFTANYLIMTSRIVALVQNDGIIARGISSMVAWIGSDPSVICMADIAVLFRRIWIFLMRLLWAISSFIMSVVPYCKTFWVPHRHHPFHIVNLLEMVGFIPFTPCSPTPFREYVVPKSISKDFTCSEWVLLEVVLYSKLSELMCDSAFDSNYLVGSVFWVVGIFRIWIEYTDTWLLWVKLEPFSVHKSRD